MTLLWNGVGHGLQVVMSKCRLGKLRCKCVLSVMEGHCWEVQFQQPLMLLLFFPLTVLNWLDSV
jgi:hypothetical protein